VHLKYQENLTYSTCAQYHRDKPDKGDGSFDYCGPVSRFVSYRKALISIPLWE